VRRGLLSVCLLLLLASRVVSAAPGSEKTIPVIFDTDIGTDIDDAYALAALVHSPELQVLGVTTVSGNAVARARLAAKLMQLVGGNWPRVPVFAGASGPEQYMRQADWAAGFTSPVLHESGAVEFMRREIDARPGEVTLIAVGELTNVAALMDGEPGIAKRIRAISLMGGSIYRGYVPGSKPEPEWNIKSNARAARTVFESGVPLLIAPLDSTADLKLTSPMRVRVFSQGTQLNDALASLNSIWQQTNTWKAENPTLFDVLAVELANPHQPYRLKTMHIVIETDGSTKAVDGPAANARVALEIDGAAFMRAFVEKLNR
jgi:purine nucleosidase